MAITFLVKEPTYSTEETCLTLLQTMIHPSMFDQVFLEGLLHESVSYTLCGEGVKTNTSERGMETQPSLIVLNFYPNIEQNLFHIKNITKVTGVNKRI